MVVKVARQILITPDAVAEDRRDHFLGRRPEQHLALVPVGDAQHLLAVGFVAAAFAPEVSRLDGRHQDFDGSGPVLLLADDRLDLFEHAQAKGQPGIDACRGLTDHGRPQHQLVRYDFGLFRSFA
jgi:hypothetical protein